MKVPFMSRPALPFDSLQKHAEKIKECAWSFQQAVECFFNENCDRFDEYMGEIDRLESEADEIKREVRTSISKNQKLPVDKFNLFMYIGEQDKVIDYVQDCLNWISYRRDLSLPDTFKKDFLNFVDAVIAPIEELSIMVIEARKYFDNFSEKQRKVVISIIHNLRRNEHEADILEDALRLKIFTNESNPIQVYHLVELTFLIGEIANHAENTGDMMRAMVERF